MHVSVETTRVVDVLALGIEFRSDAGATAGKIKAAKLSRSQNCGGKGSFLRDVPQHN